MSHPGVTTCDGCHRPPRQLPEVPGSGSCWAAIITLQPTPQCEGFLPPGRYRYCYDCAKSAASFMCGYPAQLRRDDEAAATTVKEVGFRIGEAVALRRRRACTDAEMAGEIDRHHRDVAVYWRGDGHA